MAEKKGILEVISAEEKLAHNFLRRRNLVPPINIRHVVETVADIEDLHFPGTADAILLSVSANRSRPLILLQASISPARKVFTLAHELGHIVIPWHGGTFVCHTDFDARVPNHIYNKTEAEANRFAGEILMPSFWVQSFIAENVLIPEILKKIQKAGVSLLAGTFALCRNLPPGFVFAEVNNAGQILRSGKSKDTYIQIPQEGIAVKDAEINSVAPDPDIIPVSNGKIYWWHLKHLTRQAFDIDEDSRVILRKILEEAVDDADERRSLMQSVNGIIGAANGRARYQNSDVYTILRARFLTRPQLRAVTQHALFDRFLVLKSGEMEKR